VNVPEYTAFSQPLCRCVNSPSASTQRQNHVRATTRNQSGSGTPPVQLVRQDAVGQAVVSSCPALAFACRERAHVAPKAPLHLLRARAA